MDQPPLPGSNSEDQANDAGAKPAVADKESSYYYDDATGYEVYDPAADDDDDEEVTETPDH
jgi:hypothetical protein